MARPLLPVLFLCVLTGALEIQAAVEVPSRPPARVTDLTETLARAERDRLEAKLAAFERETSHQVAVLIIPSLEGEPIEPLSHRIAASWKLGQAGKDNGVLLLVAKSDRRLRIEVGYGLEGVLPDGKAGAIIREVIAPRFRRGDFAGGIEAGVDAIMDATRQALIPEGGRRAGRLAGPFLPVIPIMIAVATMAFALAYPTLRRFPDTLFWGGNGLGAVALLSFPFLDLGGAWASVLGLLGVTLGAFGAAGAAERHRCPAGPHWLDIRRTAQGGIALLSYRCPVCDYRRTDRVTLTSAGDGGWLSDPGWTTGGGGWGSGEGIGGFSGGGGDFGGGGASGSW